WPDLMDRIARRLPRARLHFWRQEAYARSQCAILSGFLGTPLSQLPEIERPRKTASPSMRAIDEVQERAPREVSQQRARIVEDIYRRVPREAGETITLISPDVAEKLNAQYQADLALLRARYKEIGQDE
ncbi:MAG: hypothetical protein Q4G49_09345, partial [Paracoccus sp. (in: a-proteobacteria)]|nr:hypothetical protein [Paracoccus sp. (in: a-proteobacteria)]